MLSKFLHQQLTGRISDRMLHHVELVFHHVETADAVFEAICQFAEQRRDVGVLIQVELRDDVITLFARLDEVNKAVEPLTAQARGVQTVRKHPSKKQRVVTNVLADFALAVERRSRSKNGIRLEQHLPNIGEW